MQLEGRVRRAWGKLTNDAMTAIQGDREVLVGRLQERYWHTREKVEHEFDGGPQVRQAAGMARDVHSGIVLREIAGWG